MAAPDLFDVAGRVACVTGASSGLGRRAALALAAAGAKVVGVARRGEALESLKAEAEGACAAVAADVTERERVAAIAGEIAAPFGPPDILVNAAGLNPREEADAVTAQGWDATLSGRR